MNKRQKNYLKIKLKLINYQMNIKRFFRIFLKNLIKYINKSLLKKQILKQYQKLIQINNDFKNEIFY